MIRVRTVARRIGWSLGYLRDVRRTPLADREGLTRPRWWKLPLCWLRGHHFGQRGSISIAPWRLEYCRCCGEEIAWRTSWSQLQCRPLDDEDELPWDWDDEEDDR